MPRLAYIQIFEPESHPFSKKSALLCYLVLSIFIIIFLSKLVATHSKTNVLKQEINCFRFLPLSKTKIGILLLNNGGVRLLRFTSPTEVVLLIHVFFGCYYYLQLVAVFMCSISFLETFVAVLILNTVQEPLNSHLFCMYKSLFIFLIFHLALF